MALPPPPLAHHSPARLRGLVISIMPEVQIAQTPAEIERCFPLMLQLHPALTQTGISSFASSFSNKRDTVSHISNTRAPSSLSPASASKTSSGAAAPSTSTTSSPAKSLPRTGRRRQCSPGSSPRPANPPANTFSLDTATHRRESHAFYFRHGLRITDYHFQLPLK